MRALSRVGAMLLGGALVLSGCTGAGDDDEKKAADSQSPASPTAKWADWVDLPMPVDPLYTHGDRVLVHNQDNQRLQVLDAAGKEQWSIPEVATVETYVPLAAADDTNVYAQLAEPGRPLVAYAWADGKEQWRVKTADTDECAPGENFTLRLPPEGLAGADQLPLLLVDSSATLISEDGGSERQIPDKCIAGPTVSWGSVPTLFGIDRSTGKMAWKPQEDPLNNVLGWASYDVSGRWMDRVVSSRGAPMIMRTVVESGKTASANLIGLTRHGYQLGESLFITDMGGGRFYVEPEQSKPVIATVKKWNMKADNSGDDDVEMQPVGRGEQCEHTSLHSASGYSYCLLTPDSGSDGYVGRLIAGPDGKLIGPASDAGKSGAEKSGAGKSDGEKSDTGKTDAGGDQASGDQADAGKQARATYWKAPAPTDPSEGFGSESEGYFGRDPVIPRQGAAPLIALPGKSAALQAFDLQTGQSAWAYSSDPADGPGYSASYIPGVDEIVFSRGSKVVAVSAGDGKEQWSEKAEGALFHGGSAISVKTPDGKGSRLRVAVPQH